MIDLKVSRINSKNRELSRKLSTDHAWQQCCSVSFYISFVWPVLSNLRHKFATRHKGLLLIQAEKD